MNKWKWLLPTLLCLILPLFLCGCTGQPAETPAASSATAVPKLKLKPSAAASKEPNYIPIDQVGTYDKTILPDELLNQPSALPEASASNLPYWTGFCVGNKFLMNDPDTNWDNTPGKGHFIEEQFKFVSENGFNCMRILYSMSYLGKTGDPFSINESELEQLDEVLAWGMKYNLHIMISVTGLPDMQNASDEEENVLTNGAVFSDDAMLDMFSQYWAMLARRYADIPSKYLSFELLAEPAVPDGDMDLYTQKLTPVIQSIWSFNPDRIVIVNDLGKQIPEQLAELGACISLHTHIYTVDSGPIPDVNYTGHWPMEYLPGNLVPTDDVLTLRSEDAFVAGTLRFYVEASWGVPGKLVFQADGKTIPTVGDESSGVVEAAVPDGTKELKIFSTDRYVRFNALELLQPGRTDVTLATHDMYTGGEYEPMPTILIRADGTTQNEDTPQHVLDAAYLQQTYLQHGIDCAKKNNVGFLLTEVGTDTEDLTLPEYIAYHSEWLKILQENRIPWMWNYLDNVCGVPNRLWPLQIRDASTLVSIPGTPMVYNQEIFDMLKKFMDAPAS